MDHIHHDRTYKKSRFQQALKMQMIIYFHN